MDITLDPRLSDPHIDRVLDRMVPDEKCKREIKRAFGHVLLTELPLPERKDRFEIHKSNGFAERKRKSIIGLNRTTRVSPTFENSSAADTDPHYSSMVSEIEHIAEAKRTVLRTPLGTALKAIKGNYDMVWAETESIRYDDAWSPMDSMHAMRCFKFVHLPLVYLSLLLLSFLGPLSGLYGPFAMMSITGTSTTIFEAWSGTRATLPLDTNASIFTTSGNVTSMPHELEEPPWGCVLDATAVALSDIICVATIYVGMNILIFNTNVNALRLLWKGCRGKLASTIGVTVAYAVAAGTLLPDPHHLLWLVMRTVSVVFGCHLDAYIAFQRLRMTPETYAKTFGGFGKRGWMTYLWYSTGFGFCVTDLYRHYLVMFSADVVAVLDFRATNPVNGNQLGASNHELAGIAYFTSLLFMGQLLGATISQTHLGHGMLLLKTSFLFTKY